MVPRAGRQFPVNAKEALRMKCPECGAQVKAETECPYCKAPIERPASSSPNPLAAMFEDKDGNGIPDFMEGAVNATPGVSVNFTTSATVNRRYVYNGVTYGSLEEMPPEARKAMEGATGLLKGRLASGTAAAIGAPPSASTSSVSASFTVTKRSAIGPNAQKSSRGGWGLFLFAAAVLAAILVMWLMSKG
jgi:hypothetical protein